MKKVFKNILILSTGGIIMFLLQGCGSKVSLNEIQEQSDFNIRTFSDSKFENYKIDGIPTMVYISLTNVDDRSFEKYNLSLVAFKSKDVKSSFIVNKIEIIDEKNNNIIKTAEDLNLEINFDNVTDQESIKIGREILFDNFNNEDLKLNKNSRIKVIINITVITENDIITKDLEYFFQAKEINNSKLFFSR